MWRQNENKKNSQSLIGPRESSEVKKRIGRRRYKEKEMILALYFNIKSQKMEIDMVYVLSTDFVAIFKHKLMEDFYDENEELESIIVNE